MDINQKKVKSIQQFALIMLFMLLILGSGFIWGEFVRASKLNATSTDNNLSYGTDYIYATGESQIGKSVFQSKCARCHLIEKNMTGPALMNIKDRWSDSTQLYSWIKNSQAFLATGDVYANTLYKKYNSVMPAFPELSDSTIAELLYYIDP
jgi:cytochrome c551/c552